MKPERVALFAPLSSAPVSDDVAKAPAAAYAEGLIPELRPLVELHVFEQAPSDFKAEDFDAVLYLVSGDPFCAAVYRSALRHPGILVLNEPDLRNLIQDMAGADPDAWMGEVFYEVFGEDWQRRSATGLEMVSSPRGGLTMARRILDRSRACIVHNHAAEESVRRKRFCGPLARIPWGTRVIDLSGTKTRESLGLDRSATVIGMFGCTADVMEANGIPAALARLFTTRPDCRLLIGCDSGHGRILDGAKQLGLAGKVIATAQRDELEALIAACDIIWNIRADPEAESMKLALHAIGLGRTVLMSDSDQSREIPDDCCVRIPPDSLREQVTLTALEWLTSSPAATEEIGRSARQWASQGQRWSDVARRFVDFIASSRAQMRSGAQHVHSAGCRDSLLRWVVPDTAGAAYFEEHASRLSRTLELTPRARAGDRILEIGCYLQLTPALQESLGYEVRGAYLGPAGFDRRTARSRDGEVFECSIDLFNCERDPFPYPAGHFAAILCCEVIEHLKRDPMRMMCEINRVLSPGGLLILTTPNAASLRSAHAVLQGEHPAIYSRYPDPDGPQAGDPTHAREYTPKELIRLFAAAGFTIESLETGPYGLRTSTDFEAVQKILDSLGEPASLRGECIFIVGRKAGPPVDLRPLWLYDSATSDAETG